MKFLVIGLGSMGKRRIRCLKALNYTEIVGYDVRFDRRSEAEKLYGLQTVDSLSNFDLSAMDAFIISVPPALHLEFLKLAVEHNRPAFVEASVVLDGLEEINRLAVLKEVLIAPSCTLRFHPAIKDIKRIVQSGMYGKFTNFSYHSGQYLPDWHPWEKVTDYYVSQKDTGGGREIVPFELTWLIDILGYPENVAGFYGKTMDVGANIDDTYVLSLKFRQGFGIFLVDVVSRYAMRSLVLNLELAQIVWRWDEATVNVYEANNQRWIAYKQKEASAHPGYNKNIIEDMYVEELSSFANALKGKEKFPSTLADDIEVLKVLYRIENRL
ncbi:MAG TPA: Gfo/Idh/MocA family oxidoreductase [Nitrospirota bacterium]|nr:Gfo/Idh/MocA family oxidoreductase [Nitrospirota bacterium]